MFDLTCKQTLTNAVYGQETDETDEISKKPWIKVVDFKTKGPKPPVKVLGWFMYYKNNDY